MKTQSPGMRRYLYEYLFHQSIKRTQEATGKVITVSAAKRLRRGVDAALRDQGVSINDADLAIPPVLTAIETALSRGVEGYPGIFKTPSGSDPAYRAMHASFFDMAGFVRRDADGRAVQPSPGRAGPRLPISPYDPRWSVRATVKTAGSRELFVLDADFEQLADGRASHLHELRTDDLKLYSVDEEGNAVEAGDAYSIDDMSGMTELMSRMRSSEYADVRQWVADGARTQGAGGYDTSRFMSRQALARSVAVLDELRAQGVDYTVKRDLNPGQIKAEIEGTGISVRLTEMRDQEAFVGRVYDRGVAIYYTTNFRAPNSNNRTMAYTPSAKETVDLLRIAQGKPVERWDGKGLVGQPGQTHSEATWDARARRYQSRPVPDSYFVSNDRTQMMVIGELELPPGAQDGTRPVEPRVFVRKAGVNRSAATRVFGDAEAAERFLRESIYSAKENLDAAIGAESLIELYRENAEAAAAGEMWPEFSGDPEVASIQRSYWDVLRGAQTTLLRPGSTEDEYRERVSVVGELAMDTEEARNVHDMLVGEIAYTGSPEDMVMDHASDVLNDLIGSYDVHERVLPDGSIQEGRFDPARVAKYMSSEYGAWRNQAEIVQAIRRTDIDGQELLGTGFSIRSIRDKLLAFDETTAVPAAQVTDPFLSSMLEEVRQAASRSGCEVDELAVDASGVVRYSGERVVGRTGSTDRFTGEIGQLFPRGERGEVVTAFASGDNYLFAPGYEARIMPQRAGEDLSVEERTRLRGYEELMREQIQYTVTNDLMSQRSAELGSTTSLNGVYRRLYDVRHPVDFLERSAEEGLSQEWVDAILSTEARRVRYSSEIASDSTVHAAWRAQHGGANDDPANDNFADAWVLTGRRNMAIMTEASDGYFDPVMTNGAVYQGVTRYLVEGASVDPATGRILPGDKDDRAPLMKMPETESMRFDPYDRQQMSASNLMNAAAVTKPVGVAMMTFGGWTADDAMVVSKEFAEQYRIRKEDGTLRALVAGDKLSDLHGNKGVISLVVDRDMDLDEAREQGLFEEVAWFKSNPGLDVVMSPFSAVSRFNGGTARDLMKDPQDLVTPSQSAREEARDGSDSKRLSGALGTMPLIVTHKDVESGTRVYDDEALRAGRGRKASAQLAWALGSQGCDKVMAEFYGPNNSAAANFREYLVTMGLDMEPDGTLRVGYDDMQEGAERRLFEMPPILRNSRGALATSRMRADFGELIGSRGGDLEIPFPLRMPSEALTPAATDSTWRLPILSSHLRSGQDLDDGTATTHDYTNQYLTVHEMACRYRAAQEELAAGDLDPKREAVLRATVADAPRRAQSAYDSITSDLKARRFSGKRNYYREGLMSSRVPNSATAVWTSDPRLDVDQLAVGTAMAESLGLENDDYALVWRDPVLRDGGVRYLRVKVDDRLTGVAISPVVDKSFDGDFDGDSVAVVRLTSEAAKLQARQRLSMEANLLDLGQLTDEGLYPLSTHDSLDVKVSQHVDPELKERFAALTMRANEIQSDIEAGELDDASAWEQRHALVGELSDYYRDAMSSQFGDATLRFGDAGDHVRSVIEASIETGAKGSMSKIEDYCRHLGVDPATMEDLGDTRHTRQEDQGVMMAVAVKSHGTGIAGSFSQRGVKSLRNAELKSVLELTYPVTQSILQSKHDPVEAEHKYNMLMGPARSLWKGRVLERVPAEDGSYEWAEARVDGKDQQATAEQWKAQFMDFYSSKDGLNVPVSREHVDRVAAALTGSDGKIIDVEDPQQVDQLGDKASTMDRLAYGGDFSDLMAAASARENIFAGSENAHFAPFAIRDNQRALARWEEQTLSQEGVQQGSAPELDIAALEDELDIAPWDAGYDEAIAAAKAAHQAASSASVAAQEVAPLEQRPLVNRDVLPDDDRRAKARGRDRRSEAARTVRAPRPRTQQEKYPELFRDSEAVQAQQPGDEGLGA